MIAYELKLPSELAWVHIVFHVTMLEKCIGDPESILPIEGLGVKDDSLMRMFRFKLLIVKSTI